MGKEETARYEQFLLFPQCFQKLSVVDASKCLFMEYRINTQVSHFPTMFSILGKTDFDFLISFILLSASSFNLEKS